MLSAISMTTLGQQKKIAMLEPRVGEGSSGISGMEKAMVRGELRKAIVNHTGYEAFTRADIDKLMAEQDFQRTGMVSDDQIKQIGIMSGADYICISTLNKTNSEFYLEAYLVNVESAQISNPASQYGELVGGKLANMLPVCQALAQELLGTISPVVSSISPVSESKPSLRASIEKTISKIQPKQENTTPSKQEKIDPPKQEMPTPVVMLNEKIGTLMVFPDGSRGIIFYAENGVGLAVSMDATERKWHIAQKKKDARDIPQITNDKDDDRRFSPGIGIEYTRAIVSEWYEGGAPAAEWCVRHGNDWYLPSAGELVYLFKVANNQLAGGLVDAGLRREGGTLLEDGWYWSSSECNKTESINVSASGRASGEEKMNVEKVRAVRMFNY